MIKNQLKTAVLIAVLTGLLLFIGRLIGGYAGLAIAGIFAVFFNFIMYFFSDKIVLAMYRAREVADEGHPLKKVVREVAGLAGIPMPKVYIIPSKSPNAFATGRNPKHAAVAATEGIFELLDAKELRGVIAHEISHVKNRDVLITTIAATIAGVISYVASMARWAAFFGGFGGRDDEGASNLISLVVLAVLAPVIAVILQLAISRSREYLADETGARLIKDPHALASALEKLHTGIKHHPLRFGSPTTSSLFILNPFSKKGLISLFSTHPPFEERVERLKKMRY